MNSLSQQEAKTMLAYAVVVVTLAVISGCAAVKPRTAEEAVREKAQARWDAMVKGDFAEAYRYLSPGSRSVITAENFASSLRKGFWRSAQVEKVECGSAHTCEAVATIEYEHLGMRTKTPIRETWILEGADWWYLRK